MPFGSNPSHHLLSKQATGKAAKIATTIGLESLLIRNATPTNHSSEESFFSRISEITEIDPKGQNFLKMPVSNLIAAR